MFSIFFYNFGYASERMFDGFDEAVRFAKSRCFECNITKGNEVVATWTPLNGLRIYRQILFDKKIKIDYKRSTDTEK